MSAEYNAHFQRLFTIFMTQLQGILDPSINIPVAYDNGSDEEQAFIQNLAIFFTTFFRVSSHDRRQIVTILANMNACRLATNEPGLSPPVWGSSRITAPTEAFKVVIGVAS